MRLRLLAVFPVIAALLAIAPALSVDHGGKASSGSVSNDAARRSGAKLASI